MGYIVEGTKDALVASMAGHGAATLISNAQIADRVFSFLGEFAGDEVEQFIKNARAPAQVAPKKGVAEMERVYRKLEMMATVLETTVSAAPAVALQGIRTALKEKPPWWRALEAFRALKSPPHHTLKSQWERSRCAVQRLWRIVSARCKGIGEPAAAVSAHVAQEIGLSSACLRRQTPCWSRSISGHWLQSRRSA